MSRSTFYDWYRRYLEYGYEGLADRKPIAGKFWNKIPENVKEQVVDIALEYPEKSPRELAWFITDNEGILYQNQVFTGYSRVMTL